MWSIGEWLRPRSRKADAEEDDRLRQRLRQAVDENDRKAQELRLITAGALRLREEYRQ